jgi:hypothetical protein
LGDGPLFERSDQDVLRVGGFRHRTAGCAGLRCPCTDCQCPNYHATGNTSGANRRTAYTAQYWSSREAQPGAFTRGGLTGAFTCHRRCFPGGVALQSGRYHRG